MPCRKPTGSNLKKALLAAAIAAFLQIPAMVDARVFAGSVTERKQNKKIESMLKSARKNFDSGKVQPAIESYWKILELDPTETFAYLELGEVYVNLRIYDRAIELLQPGLTMAEREMDRDTICYYYCILTNAHLGLNQIGLANKSLLKAAEAAPKNPMPRKVMGDIYLANDRVADAMKAYRKAVELDPDYQPASEKLGELIARYGEQPPTKAKNKENIKEKAVKLPNADAATGKTTTEKPATVKTANVKPTIPAAKPAQSVAAAVPTPVSTETSDSASTSTSAQVSNSAPTTATASATTKPMPANEQAAIVTDEPQIQLPIATGTAPKPMPEKPPVPATDEPVSSRPVPMAQPVATASPATQPAADFKPAPRPMPDVSSVQTLASGSAKPGVTVPATATPTTSVVTADASEVQNQVDKLLAGTPEEKSAAVSFFVKLEEKGLTEIEELLYDPDPEVRVLAVRALPEFKAFNQRVKAMLQDASEDPDPIVLEEINKALQNL